MDEIVHKKLEVADYMVQFKDGYVPPIAFERKSISDLYGTMGKDYPRFKKEMNRANASGVGLILIIAL